MTDGNDQPKTVRIHVVRRSRAPALVRFSPGGEYELPCGIAEALISEGSGELIPATLPVRIRVLRRGVAAIGGDAWPGDVCEVNPLTAMSMIRARRAQLAPGVDLTVPRPAATEPESHHLSSAQ